MKRLSKFFLLSLIFTFLFSFSVFAAYTPNPYEKWWNRWGSKAETIYAARDYRGSVQTQWFVQSSSDCFIFHDTTTNGGLGTRYYFFTSTDNFLSYSHRLDNDNYSSNLASSVSFHFSDSNLQDSMSECNVFKVDTTSGSYEIYSDFAGSISELEQFLLGNNGSPSLPVEPDINSGLPDLTYTLSFNQYVTLNYPPLRYNGYIKWDYKEKSPYNLESEVNNFIYDVKFADADSAYNIDKSKVYKLDSGPLVNNEMSFSCYDLQQKIRQLGFSHEDECLILIRAVHVNSKNASPYTAFKITFGTGGHPNSNYTNSHYDDKFDPYGNDGTDSIVDDDVGKDTSDTETTSGKNPESDLYKNPSGSSKLDTSDAINGLKTSISSISEIISLLALVYSWLPSWLITLISVSVALLVVVGLIKLIIS